jgi:CheY-specific phosphatase CheX
VLTDAITETFEMMAFMDVFKTHDKLSDITDQYYVAEISSLSPVKGTLSIIVPKALMQELFAVMYAGFDSQPNLEDCWSDILGELSNTILGSLLRRVIADGYSFNLDIPKCTKVDNEKNDFSLFVVYRAQNLTFGASFMLG